MWLHELPRRHNDAHSTDRQILFHPNILLDRRTLHRPADEQEIQCILFSFSWQCCAFRIHVLFTIWKKEEGSVEALGDNVLPEMNGLVGSRASRCRL